MPRPASLSPEILSTFVTVIRFEGDATRAAEELKINQPSMSKRLAFLQHSGRMLRKPWLERIGKTWHLTEEGRRVFSAVEALVYRYKLLSESLDQEGPSLVVGCGAAIAVRFARETLKLFRETYPNESVRISQLSARERVEGVANGSLDLAVVRMSETEILEIAHRPLHTEPLWDDPIVLVSANPNFFMGDDRPSPKTIANLPLILPEPGAPVRVEFDRRCREAGLGDRFNIICEIGPWSTLIEYVLDGHGVGLLPRSALDPSLDLHVRPLPTKLAPFNRWLAISRKRFGEDDFDLSPAGVAFLESMRLVAKKLDSEQAK